MKLFAPAAIAAVLLASAPLAAQEDGTCYRRLYDAAHLAAHPEQMVEEIAFGASNLLIRDATGRLLFNLEVRLRGQDWPAFALAYCSMGQVTECALEGDAGNFSVTPDSGAAIVIRTGDQGIWMEGPDGVFELSATQGDDRSFRLNPVETAGCPQI